MASHPVGVARLGYEFHLFQVKGQLPSLKLGLSFVGVWDEGTFINDGVVKYAVCAVEPPWVPSGSTASLETPSVAWS